MHSFQHWDKMYSDQFLLSLIITLNCKIHAANLSGMWFWAFYRDISFKTWFTGLQCMIIIMSSRCTYWQPHVDCASQTESVTSNDQRLKTQPLNCHPQIQYGIVVRQSRWVTRVYVFVCMCVSTHSVGKHSFRKPVIWTCTFYNNYMVGYVS